MIILIKEEIGNCL